MFSPFKRLRVGQRLAAGFATVLLATVVVAALGLTALRSLSVDMQEIGVQRAAAVEQARDVRDNTSQIASSIRNILLADTGEERTEERIRIDAARTVNAALLDKVTQAETSAEGRELIGQVIAARKAFTAAADRVIGAGMSGAVDLAKEYVKTELRGAQTVYFAAIEKYVAFQSTLQQTARDQAQTNAARMSMLMIAVTVLAIGAAALLGWMVTASVTRPLGGEPHAVGELAQAIARGDLAHAIDASRARPGSVVASMAEMQGALRDLVAQVRASSESIVTGSSEIASGNTDLSHRTEQQASSLQQTASSIEQITATVRQNADAARKASRLAVEASGAAGAGGARVAEVVATMESMAASSRQIAEIITVIDGIAFQTNILALNAAVEAARAGEQGRGFAVVASEVRALAQRSANAAKDIKTLIGASVERVDRGTDQVGQAGQAMQEIVRQVHAVSRMLADISGATVQQTAGIEQVNSAVAQLDQTTQQNAALVEQGAAAAQSLNQQAERLQQVVAVFKLS